MNNLYLSYEWLILHGVKRCTIDKWNERNISITKNIGGISFVFYDSIPAPTRSKLPTKEQIIAEQEREREKHDENEIFERLFQARDVNQYQYRNIYLSLGFPPEKVLECSRKHAVIEELLTIKSEHRENNYQTPLRRMWKAFSRLYPGWYVYNAFSFAIRKAEKKEWTGCLLNNTFRP
jgi:hypothetical protein